MNDNKQINALKNAVAKKTQNTLNRVINALELMKANNIPINFQSVAKQANVSKTWIYAQPDIANQIKAAREKSEKIKRFIDNTKKLMQKENEVTHLKQRIQQLTIENRELKQQLEIVYGKLGELKAAS